MLYPQNAEEIEVYITTRREGLLTKIGHDLRLRVVPSSFAIEGDLFSGTILIEDIELVGSVIGDEIEVMTGGDAAKILKTMRTTVLDGKRHPSIRFSGSFASELKIDLEIRKIKGNIALKHDEGVWKGSLDHREFGIKQVKALLGSLKVNPVLEIVVMERDQR